MTRTTSLLIVVALGITAAVTTRAQTPSNTPLASWLGRIIDLALGPNGPNSDHQGVAEGSTKVLVL